LNGLVPGIPLYLTVPTTTLFLNASRARELDFSFALNITDPGGGIWDFRAADAGWQVVEVKSADADLTLSMSLDAYIRMRHFISDIPTLMETGELEVDDEQALTAYNQLFVVPDLDFEFPQMP